MKRKNFLAKKIGELIKSMNDPEVGDEPKFQIHIQGKHDWSFADIKDNGSITSVDLKNPNPWNELDGGKKKEMIDEISEQLASTHKDYALAKLELLIKTTFKFIEENRDEISITNQATILAGVLAVIARVCQGTKITEALGEILGLFKNAQSQKSN